MSGPLALYELTQPDGSVALFKFTADHAKRLGARPVTPASIRTTKRKIAPANKVRNTANKADDSDEADEAHPTP